MLACRTSGETREDGGRKLWRSLMCRTSVGGRTRGEPVTLTRDRPKLGADVGDRGHEPQQGHGAGHERYKDIDLSSRTQRTAAFGLPQLPHK